MSTSTDTLRVALFGLGRMGSHHLRAIRERDDLRLVAVADHGSDLAKSVAAEVGCDRVPDPRNLVGRVDAVVVAVPTSGHRAVAEPLLEAGVGCLVEKPIAGTAEDSRALIEAAERGGAVLQIGHVERFNPAVAVAREALASEIAAGAVQRVATRRANPPSDRTFDVDAVLDLMIHDLDLVGALVPGAIERVDAIPADCTFDRTVARLEAASGASIELLVDRAADAMVRDLIVETTTQRVRVDYAARTVWRTALDAPDETAQLPVPTADPLRSQLAAFLGAVRGERAAEVDGRAGLAALELAERVRAAAGLS